MWSRPLNPMKSKYASQMLLIDNPVWLLFSCVGLDCFIRNSNFSDGPVSTQSDNPCVVLPGAWVRPLSWSFQQFYVNRLPILSALEIWCFRETFKVFLLMQWMWSPWHRTLWGITSKCHHRGTATSPAQPPPPPPPNENNQESKLSDLNSGRFCFLVTFSKYKTSVHTEFTRSWALWELHKWFSACGRVCLDYMQMQ